MFEKLLSQIRDGAIDIIKRQSDIPSDQQSKAIDDAIASISEEIDRMMDSGDFSGLAALKDSDAPAGNAAVQNIIAGFSKKLQQNCQINIVTAGRVSTAVVPELFVKMKEKFSGGGLDIKSLMSSLSFTDVMKLMSNMGKLKEVFGK